MYIYILSDYIEYILLNSPEPRSYRVEKGYTPPAPSNWG